jgi:hypothetical protein
MKINRRKLLSLLGASPAILAGATASAQQEKSAKNPHAAHSAKSAAKSANPADVKFVGLNPKAMPPSITLIPMAPRLSSLDGKTVYLVDTGFHGGDMFLHQIQYWFAKNMPSVHTEFRRKAGPYAEDDPKLWAEIKEKGNAAIMAIGH